MNGILYLRALQRGGLTEKWGLGLDQLLTKDTLLLDYFSADISRDGVEEIGRVFYGAVVVDGPPLELGMS